MSGARGLFRFHALLGFLGALFAGAAAALVIAGTPTTAPSGASIARACGDWLGSGGPAALVGLALTAAVLAAAILAIRSVRRQLRVGRTYLDGLVIGPEVQFAGVSFRRVERREPLAFCAGYLRPRIYLSRGALDQLTDRELRAVLAHEAHHRRRRDPLRRLLARAIADALFFIPVLGRTGERYSTLGELEADAAAVAELEDRRPLAAALLKFIDVEPAPAPAVGVDPERVDHLLGVPGAGAWRLPRAALLGSLAAVAVLALLGVLIAERVLEPSLAPTVLLASACMVFMFLGPLAVLGAMVVLSRRRGLLRHP